MASGDVKRLAIVGYGKIAEKHLEVFQAAGAEVVASCNRSEQGREKARAAGITNTYESADEMIDREKPDGIICSVTETQIFNVASSLIPTGIPILVEKPVGTSLAEAEALTELAERHGTPVLVGFNRRHYSVVRKAVEDAGGFENITGAFVEWSENIDLFTRRGFGPAEIERMVFGYSIHGIDLLTYLGGDIADPQVIGRDIGEPFRWMMAVQGVTERGAIASMTSTWDSPGRWRVTFCSQGRRYVFAPLETCTVLEAGAKDASGKWTWVERVIEPDDADTRHKAGFYRQAELFLDMIETGRPNQEHGLRSALPAMRLAEQLTNACLAEKASA